MLPKVEFKNSGLPQNEDEMKDHLEEIRRNVLAGGKATDEAFERIAADIKVAAEAVESAKRANTRVDAMEQTIAALHEGGRIHNDDKIERQLRALPQLRKVAKDEDYRGKMDQAHYNLLALTRNELAVYLDKDALEWVRRFRRLNNAALSVHHIMQLVTNDNPSAREEYQRSGGIKGSEVWAPLQEAYKQGARALSTATSGSASEWMPTGYSSDKWEDVRDALEVASDVPFLPMPNNPWVMPTLLGFMRAYLVGEATTNAHSGLFTASDFTVSNRTLTAKKLGTLSYFSPESEQDSILALMPQYDEEIRYAQAYGVDDAFVSGQLTSTIDTGSAPAASDPKAGYDGLRWNAAQVGTTVDFAAGMTVEKLAAMVQAMGKYAKPSDCSFLTGYTGLAKALVLKDGNGNAVYLTRERAGEAATLFTGTVGILMGYPLKVGGVYPQNLNAAGIYDGVTTTKTGILLYNRKAWIGGNRLGLEVDADKSARFENDQIVVRSKQRVALRSFVNASATRPHVVAGVGL